MELSGAHDGRSQSDPVQASQGDDDSGSFGVKVQVQGIAGRPYVVLNAQGRCAPCSPEYPDVFLTDHQRQEFVSNMSGSASSTQTPRPDHYRSLRAFKNPSAQLLNYQRKPEILRACDPRNHRGWCSSPSSPAMVKRARIPVPGVQEPSVESVPYQPSHIICRMSGAASEIHDTRTDRAGSPRTGRVAHRSRIGPEEKRCSRSLESRSDGTGIGTEVGGFTQTDVSEVTGVRATSAGQQERSEVKEENGSGQATPDLLKGQRELPDQPDEETAKLVMVNYLKDGSCEGEAVIRQKVELMFDKIHMLKFTTLEEFEFAAPLEEVNDLKDRRAALERHVSHLQQQLQEAQQNNESLSEQKEERNTELKRLQETLERSEQEQIIVRHKLTDMEKELQTSLDHYSFDFHAAASSNPFHLSELSRLTRAHRELKERFEEERRQTEELQRRRSELEELRRSQDRVLEQLQEEMSAAVMGSEQETQKLQEERCVLEEKLSRCEFDLNEAELKTQQLQKRIKELEEKQQTHDDRHSKLMEVRVCELERSVLDERSSSDALMKRLERGREQMEQVRAEVLQERAARHELECDKIRLERQNKDLRGRVAQLEGSQRIGQDAVISKLQQHLQELEER
ncbi:cingulin-like [Sinocyclocheilus rhinocerous]|uniref:cingulin-like n=1 Tax=Sinocyclocheilus rhinocerous TaxID=307959 RepID=UPI0007B8A0CD|nr:PREDICTED: cingulin-like [Sinocyclocheilus rhinocerous]